MGGIPTPSAARALAAPERLSPQRWADLRDNLKASAVAMTGQRHEWRQRPDSVVWELVPVEGE